MAPVLHMYKIYLHNFMTLHYLTCPRNVERNWQKLTYVAQIYEIGPLLSLAASSC